MEERVLVLENIGKIKKATINISGLSVIAGKNDNGKSTIGKVMMALIKAYNISRNKQKQSYAENAEKRLSVESSKIFNRLIGLLFDGEISQHGRIELKVDEEKSYKVDIKDDECVNFETPNNQGENDYFDCTFIQTPFVWDLFDFFDNVKTIEENNKIYGGGTELEYPYLLWDLYQKMMLSPLKGNFMNTKDIKRIKKEIADIIKGNFAKDSNRKFKFYRDNQELSLKDIAVGIKQFGIVQILLNNNRLTPKGFFIFDEPENHLHPIWQIEFARILVELSKQSVPIMVNSHSPYFIEAFEKYSKKYDANVHFHLAHDGKIEKVKDDNDKTLELVFDTLGKPFRIFDELEEENG